MTTPNAPDRRHPAASSRKPEAEKYHGGVIDEVVELSISPEVEHTPTDLWGMSFAYPLSSGAHPSRDPVTLDADTAREVRDQLREIEEARAAANVSGRDYLIR